LDNVILYVIIIITITITIIIIIIIIIVIAVVVVVIVIVVIEQGFGTQLMWTPLIVLCSKSLAGVDVDGCE